MDRNVCVGFSLSFDYIVALRKESVDRNAGVSTYCKAFSGSLSARRAWIEIERPTT